MNASDKLKKIREGLGLTQAQMAGFIGINRSYLAELESDRRPIQDWVISKAEEVSRRMRGVALTKPKHSDEGGFKLTGFDEFDDAVTGLTNDELGELVEHLTECSHSCPRSAAIFYEIAIKIVLSEVRGRMRITTKRKPK